MDTQNLDRLRKTYAAMTEDELAAIAADGYDLTDAAKAMLRAEISQRGLNIELRTAAIKPDDKVEPAIRCPTCYSEKTAPVWRCGDCGNEWDDNKEGQEAP